MPIVIPSKNIFRKENQKVINNRISGISVNQNEVKLTTRNLMEFNAKMFAEESANLLWIGYLKYTNQLGALNIENVSYGGITTLNGIYCAIINITVSSGQYIYTPSISVDLVYNIIIFIDKIFKTLSIFGK